MRLLNCVSRLAGLAVGSAIALGTSGARADDPPPPPPPPTFGTYTADFNLFLIDVTGSMTSPGYGSTPKMQIAKEQVVTQIRKIQAEQAKGASGGRQLPQKFEVRVFQWGGWWVDSVMYGSRTFISFDENLGYDQMVSRLGAEIDVGGGNTPLAGATCDAIQRVMDIRGAYQAKMPNPENINPYVYVYSDGLENATPGPLEVVNPSECGVACSSCAGALLPQDKLDALIASDGTDFETILSDEGTWARKILNMARNGDATNDLVPDPFASVGVQAVMEVNMLFDYIKSSSAGQEEADYSAYGQALDEVTPAWENFFARFTKAARGRYRAFKPNASGTGFTISSPPSVLYADVNNDGCVGIVDYQKMMQSDTWQQVVRPDKPHRYPCDLDQSGRIDIGDYRILAASWAKGNCKPGDLK